MKRNKKPFSPAYIVFLLSLYLLVVTSQAGMQQLQFRTPFSLHRLQMIWEHSPRTILAGCGYLLLVVIMLVSLFRCVSPRQKTRRTARSSTWKYRRT